MCPETAVGLGLAECLAASQGSGRGGGAPLASGLRALAADDEGFISELLERFGFVSFSSSHRLLPMTGTFSQCSLLPTQLLFIFYVSV